MRNVWLWTIIGYLSGSVLYARLVANQILNVDLSQIGDGNPGTTNIGRAAGPGWAVAVFALDVSKAAVPVGIAYYILGIQDWRIIPIGLAPGIGHVYPIFYGFKGGKAIAAMAGTWVGVALAEVLLVGCCFLLYWYFSIKESGWVAILMTVCTGIYLLLTDAPLMWHILLLSTLMLFIWTHRHNLSNPPGIKPWVHRVASLWH